MPFDSNGTFNREIPGGWKADALAGIKIRADRHDTEDDGFATGLSTCITKDGRTQPTANLPMNNKKLVNLGEPDNPNDAATKNYVDNFKSFTTGATIAGAGPINGFLNFTAPTGVNGIGWTTADMSWIGRLEEGGKWPKLLAVNDKKDGTGTDVFRVDEGGNAHSNTGQWGQNTSYEGGTWRTVTPGFFSLLSFNNQQFSLYTNETATTVAYQAAAVRGAFTIGVGDSNVTMSFNMKGSTHSNNLYFNNNAIQRWLLRGGNGAAETGGNVGSDFDLHRYGDDGSYLGLGMSITRNTGVMNVGGGISTGGIVSSGQVFRSTSPAAILSAAGGSVILRPYDYNNATSQAYLDTAGNWNVSDGGVLAGVGYRCKHGTSGALSGNWYNIVWQSPYVHVYIDGTHMGAIQWQSDYRFKKNIKPLASTWEKVKSLNPVSYAIKNWGLFEKDDTPRWGFIAHEMQEKLLPTAASGSKDEENTVQQVDAMALVAALTRALQEAMTRIEALEARA